MRVSDAPVGALVFVACGCGGFRGPSPLAGPIPVAIQKPCPAHENRPAPWLELLDPDNEVSPFAPKAR